MNVVIMSDTATVNGGAAKIALDGTLALAQAGHKVHLLYGAGPVAEELSGHPNIAIHRLGEFDVVDDPNRLRAMAYGLWNSKVGQKADKILQGLDPANTIVHVHSWTKALSSSPIRVCLDRGFAVVFTIHDFLLACPTGTLFIQNTMQKCTLRPMSSACIRNNCDVHSYQHKLWRVARRLVQEHIGKVPTRVRHFIVYSRLAHNLLKPHLPGEATFHTVPHAIEVERQPPAAVATNDTFVTLGRITPEKGVAMFARAAAAENVRCRFIGAGPAVESVRRENPNAELSGWMSHRDGVNALRGARALVFPSLWYETLGLVVLEAAGNGVPSIVPDSCAASESVIDGVTGLYFRSGDEADLRAKIALMKDPVTAERMGRAAYDKFWTPPVLTLDLHRQRLETTYQAILAEHLTPEARIGDRGLVTLQ